MMIGYQKQNSLTNRAWRVYAFDMGAIRCSSCGKSEWTSKGVCSCGNPHARIDLYYQGKTHYYFQNNEGGRLTYQTARALLGVIQTELDNCRKKGMTFDPTKWKKQERRTIGKLLDGYLEHKDVALSKGRLHPGSLATIESHIKNYIRPFFADIHEDELSRPLLYRFLDSLPDLKRNTKANIYGVLKAFIKWAGYTVQCPNFEQEHDADPRISLTLDEQMEALDRLPREHRDIIEFAMETGLRPAEVVSLMTVDLTPRGTIWIRRTMSGGVEIETTKAKTKIELALSERALEIAHNHAGNVYLFINPITWHKYTTHYLRTLWRNHAGIDCTLYEATRHSFISQIVDSGASVLQTKTLARHSDVKTTQIYYHGNRTTLKDLLDRRGKVIPLKDKIIEVK